MSLSSQNSSLFNYTGLLPRRWLYHLLFWIAYYVLAVLISLSIHQITEGRYYLALLSLVPPDMALVYLNISVLIPTLLFKRRLFLYFLFLAISIFLQSAFDIWVHRLYALAGTAAYAGVKDFTVRNFSIQALNAIYLLGLTMGLKFVKDRMLQQQLLQEKERQHQTTELAFLKSQLQPHFFFNTLNNLYSLTIQKSDRAPEVVLKLADLMSYMLYESGASTVALDKEITHLENYIAIEQLRFGQRLTLSFEKEGPTEKVSIPPLLLFAFVENSFKHGLQQTIERGKIEILLKLREDHLYFSVCNPLGQMVTGEQGNGIGLKNVTRRLDLLYGSRYTLDRTSGEGLFRIHLKIPLS
ncbi:MAG TPA: histidine kinase [Puia sp.]|nr:histidine kinase [Puia sp.]